MKAHTLFLPSSYIQQSLIYPTLGEKRKPFGYLRLPTCYPMVTTRETRQYPRGFPDRKRPTLRITGFSGMETF